MAIKEHRRRMMASMIFIKLNLQNVNVLRQLFLFVLFCFARAIADSLVSSPSPWPWTWSGSCSNSSQTALELRPCRLSTCCPSWWFAKEKQSGFHCFLGCARLSARYQPFVAVSPRSIPRSTFSCTCPNSGTNLELAVYQTSQYQAPALLFC